MVNSLIDWYHDPGYDPSKWTAKWRFGAYTFTLMSPCILRSLARSGRTKRKEPRSNSALLCWVPFLICAWQGREKWGENLEWKVGHPAFCGPWWVFAFALFYFRFRGTQGFEVNIKAIEIWFGMNIYKYLHIEITKFISNVAWSLFGGWT